MNRQRHSSLWDVAYVLALAVAVVAILHFSGVIRLVTDPSSRMEHPVALPRLVVTLVMVSVGIRVLTLWLRSRSRSVG